MAVTLANSFESGQSSGTTITQGSGGNSGGGAGNFFDTVTIGTGTTVQYNSTAYDGSLSGAYTTTGTSAVASTNWTSSIGTALPHAYGRAVLNASSISVIINFARCRAAGTQVFRVTVNTAGKFELRNTGNTVLATSTTVVSTGSWYLIRWDITVGASATGILYIHTTPTSPTAAETLTANSANFGTTNIDECNYGAAVAATANVAIFRLDDILITDQGLPGPPVQSTSLTDAFTSSDALTDNIVLPRAVTDAFTTADALTDNVTLPRTITDAFTSSDAATRTLLTPRTVTDAWTTSDTVARGLILPRTVADALAASDAATRTAALPRTAADTVTTTDAATPQTALPRTVTDAWTITDTSTGGTAATRAVTDGFTAADTVDRVLTLPRTVTDAWTTSDAATRAAAISRAVTDGWLTTDLAARIITLPRHAADTWTTSDTAHGHAFHPSHAVFIAGYPGPTWLTPQTVTTPWTTGPTVTDWIAGGPA